MKEKIIIALLVLFLISGCAMKSSTEEKKYLELSKENVSLIDEKGIEVDFNKDRTGVFAKEGFVSFSIKGDPLYTEDEYSHTMKFEDFILSLSEDNFEYEIFRLNGEESMSDKYDSEDSLAKNNEDFVANDDNNLSDEVTTDKDSSNEKALSKPNKDSESIASKPSGGKGGSNVTGGYNPFPNFPQFEIPDIETPKPETPKSEIPKPEDKGRWIKISAEGERIPFIIKSVNNPDVLIGDDYVSNPGVYGFKEHTKFCWEVDGIKDLSNCKIETKVLKEPSDQITQIGIKVKQPDVIEYKYSDHAYNTQLMNLVNNHRSKNGVEIMAWDQEAQNLLKGRIQVLIDYMNKHQTLPDNHEGNLFHENISFTRSPSTPERFFNMYNGSPGHNQTMLASVFERFSAMSVTKVVNGRAEYTINVIQFR